MIAWLRGILIDKRIDEVVVNVGGVGYQVHVPLSTYYTLPEKGQEVSLLIHTHVREDLIHLYGFAEEPEREWFQHLIRISGIGPRLAINILSGISTEDLKLAIITGDATRLQAIPGIGKKTAARMVVELKERYPSAPGESSGAAPPPEGSATLFSDAVSALINLGFKPQEASKTVRNILSEPSETHSLQQVIKAALKSLQR